MTTLRPPPPPAQPVEVRCDERLELIALPGIHIVRHGDDLAGLVLDAIARAGLVLADGDILVVTSKVVSRAENRFVDLSTVDVSEEAEHLAKELGKDPRVVELVLRDTETISRKAKNVLVVRHRLGFVCANAGIDASNAQPPGVPEGSGPWALVLPKNPDRSAENLRASIANATGAGIGVVISDSFGRPFRLGTVGVALGCAGLPALFDQRGRTDLFGRELEHTITALADQVAAAADLVSGQAGEARPVVLVRGLRFPVVPSAAAHLLREPGTDLYA